MKNTLKRLLSMAVLVCVLAAVAPSLSPALSPTLSPADELIGDIEAPVTINGHLFRVIGFVYSTDPNQTLAPAFFRGRIYLIQNHQYIYLSYYETSCHTDGCMVDDYSVWVMRALSQL